MHRLLTRLLDWLLPHDEWDALLGDVAEEYERRRLVDVRWRLDLWRLRQLTEGLAFGVITKWRGRIRVDPGAAILQFLADLRHGLRGLRRAPGFTAASILSLATGIGASAAIFSVAHPVLMNPLPYYPHSDRLALVWYGGPGGSRTSQAFGTYREIQVRSHAFEHLAVVGSSQTTIAGRGEPERLDALRVSAAYTSVLGVSPSIGRGFNVADDRPNGPKVVIVSDRMWRRRLGADPAAIGGPLQLGDATYELIGVMPSAFEDVLATTTDIWLPLQYDPALPPGREWGHHLRMIGRLQSGFSMSDAARELHEIARRPVGEFSRPAWASMAQGLIVESLRDEVVGPVRPLMIAVIGAVGLLLVMACVNVTHLLLARGEQRRSEFATRAALGAGRGRLVRVLLAESLLVGILAGALGLALAYASARGLVTLSPSELPRVTSIGLNGVVFTFVAGISLLVGTLVGLWPALHLARAEGDLVRAGSARTITDGRVHARRLLVVAEVALAVVLLIGAGLLLRSVRQYLANEPGFNAKGVITMQVQVSSVRRPDDRAQHQFFDATLELVKQVPGVADAAWTSQLPMVGNDVMPDSFGVTHSRQPEGEGPAGQAFRYAVSPGYFETLSIPQRRGRVFNTSDAVAAPVRPVVVNESFARRLFGERDPIGERVRFGGPATRPFDVIVGVVGDIKHSDLAAPTTDGVYVVASQWLWADNPRWLVVRAGHGRPAALVPAIKQAVWSVDADAPISRIATMEQLLARNTGARRFALIVFEAFGGVALLLAAIGIFGVLSGSVTERRRELGVRAALGASHRELITSVVARGLRLTAVGVAIGLAAAILASRSIEALLYGVRPFDPLTYGAVVALLAVVAVGACWVPAWRAGRVDPVVVLRAE